MKLSEVIAILEECPNKKFKSDCYEAYVNDGLFEVIFNGGVRDFAVDIERAWEEVKEPVTWQEAVEASISGKRITIEYENKIYEQERFLKIGCLSLDGTNSYGFDRKMLTEGKWYIEDWEGEEMKQSCNCGEIPGKKTILNTHVVVGITTEFLDNGVFKNNKALTLENNYCPECGGKYENCVGGETDAI